MYIFTFALYRDGEVCYYVNIVICRDIWSRFNDFDSQWRSCRLVMVISEEVEPWTPKDTQYFILLDELLNPVGWAIEWLCDDFEGKMTMLKDWGLMTHIWDIDLVLHWFSWWIFACFMPSHYLNQCWFGIWTLGKKIPIKIFFLYRNVHDRSSEPLVDTFMTSVLVPYYFNEFIGRFLAG